MKNRDKNRNKHRSFMKCCFKDNRIEYAVEVLSECIEMDPDDTGLPMYTDGLGNPITFTVSRIFVEKGNDEIDVIWKLQHNADGNLFDIDGNIVKAIDFLGCKINRILPLAEYKKEQIGM